MHQFYGDEKGYRMARKHVAWYMQMHDQEKTFRSKFNALESASEQLNLLNLYFDNLTN